MQAPKGDFVNSLARGLSVIRAYAQIKTSTFRPWVSSVAFLACRASTSMQYD